MRALLLLALAFLPSAAPASARAAAAEKAVERREIRFSEHALKRMAERGVGREQVLRIVRTAPPFRYFHDGSWKTGYYDPVSRVFIASAGGVIITVFTDATPRYVERLKRARPRN